MKLTTSIFLFSMFSSSALVGGILYKDKSENMNISQSVDSNKGNSFITKLVQTHKDLNKVKYKLGEWGINLSDSEDSWYSNETWKEKIIKNLIGNSRKDKELNTRLNKKEGEFYNLESYSKIKDENREKFKVGMPKLNKRISELKTQLKKLEAKNKSNKIKKEAYDSQKQKLKSKLGILETKKSKWKTAISNYPNNKKNIVLKIKDNQGNQKKLKNNKIKTQKYLTTAYKNQTTTENATDEIASDISIIQKTILDLKTRYNELNYEKDKLQLNISNI